MEKLKDSAEIGVTSSLEKEDASCSLNFIDVNLAMVGLPLYVNLGVLFPT